MVRTTLKTFRCWSNRILAGGVYLHWSFWCNVADDVQRRLCDASLHGYATEMIDSRRERDFRFTFYRLHEP